MKVRLITTVLIFLSVVFAACEADIDIKSISDEIALQPSLVIPIVSANVSVGQLLAAHYHGENLDLSDNNEISYIHKDSAEFKLPALKFMDYVLPLAKNLYPSPGSVINIPANTAIPTISSTDSIILGINSTQNSDRIDSIKVTSVAMSVTINVTPDMESIDPADLKLFLVFPADRVRMTGGVSNIIEVLPIAYGMPINVLIPGFMLNTAGGANDIPVQLSVDAKSGSVPLTLSPNSAVTCDLKLSKLVYSVAYGNFESTMTGNFVHHQSTDIAEMFSDGLLKFSNPQLRIRAISNIGTYLSFNIDYVKTYISSNAGIPPVYAWFNGHTTTSVAGQFDSKPATPGLSVSKDFRTFDKDWGETNLLFESGNMPDMIEYKFSAGINKTLVQNDPTPSFITPDANLKVYMTYTLPFQLNKGSYYEYRDTTKNIFSQIAAIFEKYAEDRISSVAVVLAIKNGLPVQTQLSLYFLDSLGRELLSDLEKNYTVEAGNVDANGIVQPGSEKKQTITIVFTKAQIPELRKVGSIVYSVRLEGENAQSNIHLTKLNTFDLKLGLFVKGDINENIGTIIK